MKCLNPVSYLVMKMRSKCSEEKHDSFKRVSLFLCFFFILFLVYLLLNVLVMSFSVGFFYIMGQFSSSPFPGTLIRLDYLGFILPLVISSVLIVWYLKLHPGKSSKSVTMVVIILLCFDLFFSAFYHQLRLIGKHSGSFDILATIVTLFYIAYLAYIDSYKEGMIKAYIFGFLIGLISDLESIRYLTSTTVFGGGGLLDGDFVFPLLMLISFDFAFWRQKNKGRSE